VERQGISGERIKHLRAAAITAAQLARLLAELRQQGDLGALRLLLDRFHRLAAWSGVNGFSAISAAAQCGEHDCSALVGAGIKPEDCHLDQIRALIHLLRREIALQRTSGAICEDILWGRQAQGRPRDGEVFFPSPRRLLLAPELPRSQASAQHPRMPHDFEWSPAEPGSEPDAAPRAELDFDLDRELDDAGPGREPEREQGSSAAASGEAFAAAPEAPPAGAGEMACREAGPAPVDGAGGSPLPDPSTRPPEARETAAARILYLEADPDQAPAVRELLDAAGYRMRANPQGFYSTDLSRETDVLLVDLPRPTEDAGDLVRRLWANPGSAAVPVVFLTGDAAAPAYAMSVGGAEYLARPVEPRLLLSTVASRLERCRALETLFAQAR
jgi:CheY-like chemotaxis protein